MRFPANIKVLLLLLCVAASASQSANSANVRDFALLDSQREFHQLSRYTDYSAVLIYVHQSSCAVSGYSLPKLASLAEQYQGEVKFFVMNVGAELDASLAQAVPSISVLRDELGLVSNSLGIRSAGNLLMIDPSELESLFLGPIDDAANRLGNAAPIRLYLEDALQSIAGDAATSVSSYTDLTSVSSCELVAPANASLKEIPSYTADIAPILEQRCAFCHREQGTAPWAMTSHRMVQGWAPMMRETLLAKRMPPGQIDTDHSLFDGVNYIPDDELLTLINWIDAGAPATGLDNESDDPLLQIAAASEGWQLGIPDEVFSFEEQSVPASGVLEYLWLTIDPAILEDKWIQAYEFKIGDTSVVHHARIFTQSKTLGGIEGLYDFAAYAPGKSTIFYPEGIAQHFSKDDNLVMQIHYTTSGRATTDQTSLGLHYADGAPEQTLIHPITVNEQIAIPAGDRDHAETASITLDKDSYLYAMSPHMHYRGKSMKYTALLPGGEARELLSVPNYQFQWQMNYWLKEPLFLPAGTVIKTDGKFDNSGANPYNPNPDIDVTWGEQSWEEMFIGWMAIAVAND